MNMPFGDDSIPRYTFWCVSEVRSNAPAERMNTSDGDVNIPRYMSWCVSDVSSNAPVKRMNTSDGDVNAACPPVPHVCFLVKKTYLKM